MLGIIDKILWFIKWIIGKRDDPEAQLKRAKEQNEKIIADGDADALNKRLRD